MYRIDFSDLRNAAEILYCFMTMPSLYKPECSVWSSAGIPKTMVNDGTGFLSEDEFVQKIVHSDFAAITCVASTDKEDKYRVVLGLMDGLEFMTLNFPSSNGVLTEAEYKLLKMLEM